MPRPRVLLVSHWLEGEGGIEEHQGATVRQLAGEVAFTVIAPRPPVGAPVEPPFAGIPGVRVTRPALHGHAIALRVIGLPAETRDARAEEAFRRELANGHDLVHFQSVVGWNTLRLPRIAREAGARVVVSVHDKSWLCADFNMVLGPQGAPCGRPAARGNDAMCVPCIASKASAHAPLTAGQVAAWLESRYAAAADALSAAHAVACPSEFAASSVRRAFGDSLSVRVIPHGVPDWPALEAPTRGATLRVVHLGRFSMRKGAGALIAAAHRLRPERIDIDAWGPVERGLEGPAQAAGIRLHGPYRNHDLPSILARADLVVVPTPLEETFCLVVAEAQQLGVPVAACASGAIPERVREGESGFLLPPNDPGAIAALLLRLRDDPAALERVRLHLRARRRRTQAECASDYLALYRAIIGA